MPRIIVTSDLHLGITGKYQLRTLAENIAAERPDLTILAGDIGEGMRNFVACLDIFSCLPGVVGVLAGNHDVWARYGYHSKDLWECYLPRAVRAAGMLWLEDMTWRHDGVAVVGSMAWYDYSAADTAVPPYPPEFFAVNKGKYNADGWHIDWPWADSEFADRLGERLIARLDHAEHDASLRAILVVTHVPLCEEQIVRRVGNLRWGLGNAYFGNLTLGRRVLQYQKVRAIISGHTHVGRKGDTSRQHCPGASPVQVMVVPSDYQQPDYVRFRLD
jgi:predicted phosphohydrolase